MVIWTAAPFVFEGAPAALSLAHRGLDLFMLLVAVSVLNALRNAVNDIYLRYPVAQRIPIRGYLQVIQIVAAIAVGIFAVSIATETSPWAS